MRVPRIGNVFTPRVKTGYYRKLTDPPCKKSDCPKSLNFGKSTAYYLKKYVTLPPEIKRNLSANDAVDMFKEMEYIANGVVKRKSVGQGSESRVYENPWLKGCYFIILNTPDDAKLSQEKVYTDVENLGDAIWQDNDDSRIQLLG